MFRARVLRLGATRGLEVCSADFAKLCSVHGPCSYLHTCPSPSSARPLVTSGLTAHLTVFPDLFCCSNYVAVRTEDTFLLLLVGNTTSMLSFWLAVVPSGGGPFTDRSGLKKTHVFELCARVCSLEVLPRFMMTVFLCVRTAAVFFLLSWKADISKWRR